MPPRFQRAEALCIAGPARSAIASYLPLSLALTI